MKKQYVWAMVATLGLVGCGGGGGDSDSPGADTGNVTAAELQGTWMWTTETEQGGVWVSTRRQTFTLTRSSNSVVRFKDCFETTTSNWNLSNDTLSRSGQPTLTVVDEDTLTATSGSTQIRLVKLNSSTSPVVADVNINYVAGEYVGDFTWNPACVDTFVTDAGGIDNRLRLKVDGRNDASFSGSVTLDFVSSQAFPARSINYSAGNRGDENITGEFSVAYLGVPVASGDLSNPTGIVNFDADENVVMYFIAPFALESTSDTYPEVNILGSVQFNTEWLAQPTP